MMSNYKKHSCSLALLLEDDNWVQIYVNYVTNLGTWLICNLNDEDNTLISGGLWFNGIKLIKYDGCSQLPDEVIICLKQLGFMADDCE